MHHELYLYLPTNCCERWFRLRRNAHSGSMTRSHALLIIVLGNTGISHASPLCAPGDPSLKLQWAIRHALRERVLLNLQRMSYRTNYLNSRDPPSGSRRDDKITLRTSSHAYVVKSDWIFDETRFSIPKRYALLNDFGQRVSIQNAENEHCNREKNNT